MAEKRFSELTTAGAMTGAELLAMSQETLGTLLSVKSTLQNIANWFAVNSQYASALDTSNKTLCGAINELRQLISLIPQFSIEVVQTLPTEDISETTIYLVPSSEPEQGNYYEEYIYVNNTWELVGTTAVDLSAYYTKLEVDGLLAAKANTSDVTAALALKEAKADMDDDVTDIVVALTDEQTTTPGNPVTLTTEQSGGAKSAVVTFTPKQSGSGDPSPDNVRPISGWDGLNLTRTGKNLANAVSTNVVRKNGSFTEIYGENNSVTIPVTTVGSFNIVFSVINILAGMVGKTICVSGNRSVTGSSTSIDIVKKVGNTYSGKTATYTLTDDDIGSTFCIRCNNGSGQSCTFSNIQFEFSNSATDFEPYQGETHTATFDTPIPGGSYNFVDGNGQTIYGIYVFDGSEAFSAQSGNRVYISSITDALIPETTTEVVVSCSHFLGTSIDDSSGTGKVWKNQGNYAITFRDTTYGTDAITFKNFLTAQYNANTPVTIAYKLATPTPISLVPSNVNLLKGTNTVWSDANGTVTVGYAKIPNGNLGAAVYYIKKLEERIAALES